MSGSLARRNTVAHNDGSPVFNLFDPDRIRKNLRATVLYHTSGRGNETLCKLGFCVTKPTGFGITSFHSFDHVRYQH